jgi:hypothetical protein
MKVLKAAPSYVSKAFGLKFRLPQMILSYVLISKWTVGITVHEWPGTDEDSDEEGSTND